MIRALELLGAMQTRARSRALYLEKSEVDEGDAVPASTSKPKATRNRRPKAAGPGPADEQEERLKREERVSPYFSPTPRKSLPSVAPPTPLSRSSSPPARSTSERKRKRKSRTITDEGLATPTRKKRTKGGEVVLPPTPDSLPRPKRRRRKEVVVEIPVPSQAVDEALGADKVVAPNEQGVVEAVDKILLLQERVRHDPWKLLVATSLLNKTTGRAVRPIYWELLRRYPTPQAMTEASVPDLAALIYPLGLYNQRASSLIRMSLQYLSLRWPLSSSLANLEELSAIPFVATLTPPLPVQLPEAMDAKVFYGAGVYASDSFRIYSSWFPGRGGPEGEEKWIAKRRRAMERRGTPLGEDGEAAGVEEVGGYLSDEEGDDGGDEWRRVRPLDKELRRYLIWRWGLEGITYDIARGPIIKRSRDRRRLAALLEE